MVFEVARASMILGSRLPLFVEARLAEALVGMPIIFGEIEIVLDERGADEDVVADTIAAHPRIEEREGQRKTRPKRSADLPKRCTSDVLKSRKRADRARLRPCSVRKARCHWQNTVDEFQLDCKSNQASPADACWPHDHPTGPSTNPSRTAHE